MIEIYFYIKLEFQRDQDFGCAAITFLLLFKGHPACIARGYQCSTVCMCAKKSLFLSSTVRLYLRSFTWKKFEHKLRDLVDVNIFCQN